MKLEMNQNYKKNIKVIAEVTCIMSIYKKDRVKWVEEAILSIMNEKHTPRYFLIYCDGPISKSIEKLLNKMCIQFSKTLKVYKGKSNKGRAYARQLLLMKSKTKYVLLMDADDISVSNRLNIQYTHAISNPKLDIIGGYIIEFSNYFSDRIRKVPLFSNEIKKMLRYAQPFNHVTLLAKRKYLLAIGGYKEAGNCEDFFLIARCIVSGAIVENIAEILVRVRVDESFLSRRKSIYIGLDEVLVLKFLWNEKYINFLEFAVFSLYRISIRTLPRPVISWLYSINRSKVI